jgi:hypothetical protein
MGTCRNGYMETWRHRYGDMNMETWTWRYLEWTWKHGIFNKSNGKEKPSQFSLIRLRFAFDENRSLSFACLLKKKNRSYTFANGLNELAHLCISASNRFCVAFSY